MKYFFNAKSGKQLLLVGGLIVLLSACSKSDTATETANKKPLPEPDSPGAKLLVEFCSECHAYPHPSSHVKGEWKSVIERMSDNRTTDGYDTLTGEEMKTLVEYMDKHAAGTTQ